MQALILIAPYCVPFAIIVLGADVAYARVISLTPTNRRRCLIGLCLLAMLAPVMAWA